jgi:N-acetylneuraminic acid mutarotase
MYEGIYLYSNHNYNHNMRIIRQQIDAHVQLSVHIKLIVLFKIILMLSYPAAAQTDNNVGIGTSNPQQKLHVAGSIRVDSLSTTGTAGSVITATPNGDMKALPFSSFDQRKFLNSAGKFDTVNEVPFNAMLLSASRNDALLISKGYRLYGAMQMQKQFSSFSHTIANQGYWYPTYVEGNAGKLTPSVTTTNPANILVDSELIVFSENRVYSYNPLTDLWTLKNTLSSSIRSGKDAIAIHTGSEIIVFGGGNSSFPTTPFRYDPVTGTAVLLPTDNQPSPRKDFSVTWTGFEMVVWGGFGLDIPSGFSDGAYYTLSTNIWTTVNQTGALTPRGRLSAARIDSDHILYYGGTSSPASLAVGDYKADGKIYNPYLNTWSSPISAFNAPTARAGHTSTISNGTDVYFYGGYYSDGTSSYLKIRSDMYKYSYDNDTWTLISGTGTPLGRYGHAALPYNGKIYYINGFVPDISGIFYPDSPGTASYGYEFNVATGTWVNLGYTYTPVSIFPSCYSVDDGMLLVFGGTTTQVTDDRQYISGSRYLFTSLTNFPATYINPESTVYLYQKN